MIVLSAVAVASIALCAVLLLTGRRMESSRAIRVHLPLDVVWEGVRDFGALHASHARGRPALCIASTHLVAGDGRTPRSVWTQTGRWRDRPYWAEIELLSFQPPHGLAVRLLRDSLGTERGLRRHRCEIRLTPVQPRETRVVLEIGARFGGLRLPLLRRLAPARLRPRLLDLAMRSVKHTLGALEVSAPPVEDGGARAGASATPEDFAPPPASPPPMGDRV